MWSAHWSVHAFVCATQIDPSRDIFVGLSAQAVGLPIGALVALDPVAFSCQSSSGRSEKSTNDVWLLLELHAEVGAAVGTAGSAAFAISKRWKPRLQRATESARAGVLRAAVFFLWIGTCRSLRAGASRPSDRIGRPPFRNFPPAACRHRFSSAWRKVRNSRDQGP